jgi:hypothetical protein
MIPDLDTRIISIDTRWPGATPQDVEKEILIEQEEYLRGLPNLKRMTSLASTGTRRDRAGVPLRHRSERGPARGEQRAQPGAVLSGECR